MAKRPKIPEIDKKTLEAFPTQMVGQPAPAETARVIEAPIEAGTAAVMVEMVPAPPEPAPAETARVIEAPIEAATAAVMVETVPAPPEPAPAEAVRVIEDPVEAVTAPAEGGSVPAPTEADPASAAPSATAPIPPAAILPRPSAGLPLWSIAPMLGIGLVSGWLLAAAIGPSDGVIDQAVAEAVQAERARARVVLEKSAQDVARAQTERDALRDARARTDQAVTQALGLVTASDAGRPMRELASRTLQAAGDDRQMRDALARLLAFAEPVATRAVLAREFEVQAARLPPPSEPPMLIAAGAQLWSRIMGSSSAGDARRDSRADSIGTAREALARGDLALAIQALRGLDDAAQPRMQGWIEAAQVRLALDAAVEQAAATLVIKATRRFVE